MFKLNKLDLLVSIYIFCIIVSELMGIKTFPLINFGWLHLNASVAILLIPIVYSINDVIAEVYGRDRARSLVRSGIFVVFLTFIFAAIATSLPPSLRFQGTEEAYDTVFVSSLRIAAASLAAFAIAEVADVFIFVKLRKRQGKKALWLRTNVSNFIAQFLDTSIFISLAFYSFAHPFDNNIGFLASLIVPYWLLKCLLSVIGTPLVYAGVKWLRDKDKS
jgi:uncharacterized integral membrane protein (TIGR00697 family)